MESYKLFIDGEFVEAESRATYESIDPGTEMPIATVSQAGPADAERAIEAARRAFDRGDWSNLAPAARADKIYDFADQINRQSLRLAVTESMDAGQVIGLTKYWGMLGSQLLRNLAYYASTNFPWEEEIPYSGNIFAPGRDFCEARTDGCMRGHNTLEFSSINGLLEDCPGHHHGKYHRFEAG
jgi:aldehyde dehydrogenase (NAD+)